MFTFVAGTGHVAYSVLPVIAEVATETKIRPERPLGIAVIASQQAITASPISAATVALLGLLAGFDITLFDILKITIPATIIGVLVGALFSMKVGKELVDDPEYQKRLAEGYFNSKKIEIKDVHNRRNAMISASVHHDGRGDPRSAAADRWRGFRAEITILIQRANGFRREE